MTLKERRELAVLAIGLYPNVAECKRCWLPWNKCKPKSVMTSPKQGTFAVCTDCWNEAELNELKAYYTVAYFGQIKSIAGSEYKVNHSLEHLLKCLEEQKK